MVVIAGDHWRLMRLQRVVTDCELNGLMRVPARRIKKFR